MVAIERMSDDALDKKLKKVNWKKSKDYAPYLVEALKRQRRRSWRWLLTHWASVHDLIDDMTPADLDEVGLDCLQMEARLMVDDDDSDDDINAINLAVTTWRILQVYFLQRQSPDIFLAKVEQQVHEGEDAFALIMGNNRLSNAIDLLEKGLTWKQFYENDDVFLNGGKQYLLDLIERHRAEKRRTRMAAMEATQSAVLARAKALEEEEAQRLRSRRQSDPRIAQCSNMNKVCRYTPLDMEDWCEHDANLYYGPDEVGKCFDASELLRHFESQMTSTKYGNPYPQYPTDPWTREAISLKLLLAFASFCENRGVSLIGEAPTFKRFLDLLVSRPEMDMAPIQGRWLQEVVDKVVGELSEAQSGGSWFAKIFG